MGGGNWRKVRLHRRGDIITLKIEPKPWLSSCMFQYKINGKVRICLDSEDLNWAIIRQKKPWTVETNAYQLASSIVFTKASALQAFLQVHLTETASKLIIFNRCSFKRVPYDAKMSQNILQVDMEIIMRQEWYQSIIISWNIYNLDI